MPGTKVTSSRHRASAQAQAQRERAPRKRAAAGAATQKADPLADPLTAVAAGFITPRREDAQALVEAGRLSAAGVKAVLQRCQDIVRETLSELRSVARLMQHVGARESVAQFDKLAVALVMLSISSVREIAALASTTQRAALDVLASRLQEDLQDFRRVRSKKS